MEEIQGDDFVIKEKIDIGPVSRNERIVYSWIMEICGPSIGKLVWDTASSRFTIPENINHYMAADFYNARALYVLGEIKEEMKRWP